MVSRIINPSALRLQWPPSMRVHLPPDPHFYGTEERSWVPSHHFLVPHQFHHQCVQGCQETTIGRSVLSCTHPHNQYHPLLLISFVIHVYCHFRSPLLPPHTSSCCPPALLFPVRLSHQASCTAAACLSLVPLVFMLYVAFILCQIVKCSYLAVQRNLVFCLVVVLTQSCPCFSIQPSPYLYFCWFMPDHSLFDLSLFTMWICLLQLYFCFGLLCMTAVHFLTTVKAVTIYLPVLSGIVSVIGSWTINAHT